MLFYQLPHHPVFKSLILASSMTFDNLIRLTEGSFIMIGKFNYLSLIFAISLQYKSKIGIGVSSPKNVASLTRKANSYNL